MRIGIDARMLGFSGIGRYTENIIQELLQIDKKNEYVLFVQKKFQSSNHPIIQSSNFKAIEVDAPIYSLKEQSNFLRAVVKQKLDVMHFTHFNVPFLYRRPYIVTIHDLTPLYFPGKKRNSFLEKSAYKLILKNALKNSKKIIAVSNFTKKDILKNFPSIKKEKITVIYEGAGAADAAKCKIKNAKCKITIKNSKLKIDNYILYVGVWREHKNLKGLICAFEKLKSQGSKFKALKLVIVGRPDPIYKEVELATENSKYKNDIILTGYVKNEELPLLYKNATAFVFPSFYEGFGLPPLEAMSLGLPVVSSNTSSLPEILADAALYFNPRNTKDMVEKIKKVVLDKKLRSMLIEKGKKQVLKYSWREAAKETLKIYKMIS